MPVVAREALWEVREFFVRKTLAFYGRDRSTPLSKNYIVDGPGDAIVTITIEAASATKAMDDGELAEYRKKTFADIMARDCFYRSIQI